VVVEQTFIDRAEFFDIQRGIVHTPGRRRWLFPVIRQMPEGFEEVAVADAALVEVERLEKRPVEGGHAQTRGKFFVRKHLPQHLEAAPDVLMVGVGAAPVEQPPQPRHAVMLPIKRAVANQPPVFGNQQEEQAIDQTQELPVKVVGGEW
jgi:hypothetical protein